MDSSLGRRRVVISDDNLGPVVSIVSILLLILVVLTLLTRLATGCFMRRRLILLEDGLVSLSTILSVGELVTVLGMDNNGLGSPIRNLSSDQVKRFQQYSYSNDVLYVCNVGFTISSLLLLIHSLTPVKAQRFAAIAVLGVTTLWTISSGFALLFQCHTPQTWQFVGNQCINRSAFWVFYTIAHVVIEFSFLVLPIILVWNLRLSRGRKWLVVLPFTLRILVIIPAVAQAAAFEHANGSDDPTFDLWPAVICAQITQSIGIITACFIHLKPFLSSLNSGLLQNDETRRRRRQGSQSASGYLTLSHNSAKARSRNDRGACDVQVSAAEDREEITSSSRDPWSHYNEDMADDQDETGAIRTGRKRLENGRVIHHTTSIAVEYSKRESGGHFNT